MSTPQAFDAIEDAIRDGWGATTPIAFENEGLQLPDEPAAFLFVEIIGGLFQQASIGGGTAVGDNLWREDGQVNLHVLVPKGTGSSTARGLALQAANILRGRDLAGIRFGGASIGAGEPGSSDGNYWRMTATIDWERDE